jgi:hypothetical protein
MSVVEQPKGSNLIARVQNILLRPKAEWDVIETESATVQSLFVSYAAILAAIPAVAGLIGSFFPVCILGVCIHINPIFAIVGAVVNYLVSLAGVFVIGLIIDALAPSFGGQPNQIMAMKVSVYSFTAAWLAGVFSIFPPLGILGIVGLYSFYLLYLGLPKLMKSPADKAIGYTIVSILLGIVVFIIAGVIGGTVTRFGSGTPGISVGMNTAGRTVTFGNGSVDLGKLQAAAQQAEASVKQVDANGAPVKVAAIDPEKLKALLPDTVGGLPRSEVSTGSSSALGGAANVEAVYQQGDSRVTVSVTDLAGASAFAGLASAFNVQSSRETATGYERTSNVNGRMTTEEWDNQSHSGRFSILVASRFVVEANGSAPSVDMLKAAVASVGPDRLEGLAHS